MQKRKLGNSNLEYSKRPGCYDLSASGFLDWFSAPSLPRHPCAAAVVNVPVALWPSGEAGSQAKKICLTMISFRIDIHLY
jgi:hypothetical protein